MTASLDIAPLRTPEEVAELLVHISPFTIRRMVQKKEIAYTPGARGKVLFSQAQINALLEHLAVPAGAPAPAPAEDEEDVFKTSSRSKARRAS
ncbi:helix-turn-helix DNA binding domain protein [Arthrobacter phage Sonali]|uniref:Helix-turn-helix DNA binding domain protein n=1 Tax=Arthrobacter phage Sonali TaxID=2510495 RepID=A0A411CQZ3_9CAUD|nr:helix-turn-helix DNA binding domain protein [Arthrobacter phage Sonali]QAY16153.1 helix-turn-helix DNA binding domain protein [Arthrobacter phage Sonali]